MSFRTWLSGVTVLLVVVILFTTRHELVTAWGLLQRVDLRILALLPLLQLASYAASGAMLFSYLRQKGALSISPLEAAKMSLELNFVNHILPSAGVSGASYMTWRLGKVGVSPGRATMAQVVRLAAMFGTFVLLLVVSLVVITLDGTINRLTILVTSGLASTIIFVSLFVAYVIGSQPRLQTFSRVLTRHVNRWHRALTRRSRPLLDEATVRKFFEELHEDYGVLRREPRLLLQPLGWGLMFNVLEVSLFVVTFWALGTPINPAPLLIAMGVATVAGSLLVTPGGVGGYEVLMIAFLVSAGISQAAAVAAILLTRTLLILFTIGSGYIFYQMAINKYSRTGPA